MDVVTWIFFLKCYTSTKKNHLPPNKNPVCVCVSLKLCVMCAGVAVKVKRPSDEIIGEGKMATCVS